jgi:putative MATE family efflux protein
LSKKTARELTLGALAWPIFVEQALRILIGTVDTFMVSHVSDGAVAAVGVATQVVILAIILFNFIGIGSSVVITHHLGAGDREGADRITRAAVGVNTWVGLVVSLLVAFFADPLLHLMQLPESLHHYARPFLVLMGGTLFLEAQNIAVASTLRAHGHTRAVMLTTGFQNVINALGNALLLFGLFGLPKLGVPGVAVSGIVSRLVCFVILRALLPRTTGVRLQLRDYFVVPPALVRRVLAIGLPAAGENLSYWLALITITSFASQMGESSLAAFAYSRQLTIWVMLGAIAIALANEILVGHLIGAGEIERAKRVLVDNLKKGFAMSLTCSGIVALAAPYLMTIFTRDPAVIAGAVTLQRLGMLLEPGRVFNMVAVNGLRATGDARFPLFMGACIMWGVWVPLAWLLGIHFELGLAGLCLAMITDEWLRGVFNLGRWQRGGWIKHAMRSRSLVGKAEERGEPAT